MSDNAHHILKFQQGVLLFKEHLHSIGEALTEFHDLKNVIIQACRRKAWLATLTYQSWEPCNGLCLVHGWWVPHSNTPPISQSAAIALMSRSLTDQQARRTSTNSVAVIWIATKNLDIWPLYIYCLKWCQPYQQDGFWSSGDAESLPRRCMVTMCTTWGCSYNSLYSYQVISFWQILKPH